MLLLPTITKDISPRAPEVAKNSKVLLTDELSYYLCRRPKLVHLQFDVVQQVRQHHPHQHPL